jgi:hypothetical protein
VPCHLTAFGGYMPGAGGANMSSKIGNSSGGGSGCIMLCSCSVDEVSPAQREVALMMAALSQVCAVRSSSSGQKNPGPQEF